MLRIFSIQPEWANHCSPRGTDEGGSALHPFPGKIKLRCATSPEEETSRKEGSNPGFGLVFRKRRLKSSVTYAYIAAIETPAATLTRKRILSNCPNSPALSVSQHFAVTKLCEV